MKKSILIFTITVLLGGTLFTNCKSSSQKVEDAQDKVENAEDKVTEANIELNQAINDSIVQFRKESNDKIIAQQKSIAAFRARIAKEKKENKADYEKKLAALEQKNTDLKKSLDDYKAEGKENWTEFKADYNRKMEQLTQDFNELSK